MIDHETATTTLSLDDIRAVATAFARVAASLCDDVRAQTMFAEFLAGNIEEMGAILDPINDEYRADYPSLPRVRCVAAFSNDGAACARDNPDANEVRFDVIEDKFFVNSHVPPRDVYLRCVAAFAIDGAARAYAEPDAYEAIFAARTARQYCECVVQCIDFGVVDLSGPNHAASLAKVHALASKYVSAETIAAVLA